MGPVLEGLVRLQTVENLLRAAKGKLTRCRRNVLIHENQIRSLQNTLESKKEEMQLTKVQADRLELELKVREEEIAKLRASLNTAKTNKEYSTLLTHLNTTKADNSKIETQVFELLKEIETDESECRKIKEDIEEQKKQLEQKRKEAEILSVKYEEELNQIQKQWDEIAATIPGEPLEMFKRVAETYDGQALAKIEQKEGKSQTYSCGGCFMNITPETVNMLMTREDILRCPICSRILVLDEHVEK